MNKNVLFLTIGEGLDRSLRTNVNFDSFCPVHSNHDITDFVHRTPVNTQPISSNKPLKRKLVVEVGRKKFERLLRFSLERKDKI